MRRVILTLINLEKKKNFKASALSASLSSGQFSENVTFGMSINHVLEYKKNE